MTSPGAAVVAELVDASFGYASRPVLADVQLAVREGDLVVVFGPNGAGKTSLLRGLAATLLADTGVVRLGGDDVRRLDRTEIARRVAVVPQEVPSAPGFSVRDVVMMGRAPHQDGWLRVSPRDERIVDEMLARCGVEALQERTFDALSGGERKRVLFAQAFAQEPRLLLLDEPSAFLDLRHALELFELLRAEIARGLAVVATAHDLLLGARYATTAILLDEGRVRAHGKVDEVLTERHLRDVFGTAMTTLSDADGNGALLPTALLRRHDRDER